MYWGAAQAPAGPTKQAPPTVSLPQGPRGASLGLTQKTRAGITAPKHPKLVRPTSASPLLDQRPFFFVERSLVFLWLSPRPSCPSSTKEAARFFDPSLAADLGLTTTRVHAYRSFLTPGPPWPSPRPAPTLARRRIQFDDTRPGD